MELEEKARQAMDWMKDQSLETAKEKALEWTKDYLQLDKTRFTVWDPQRGDFQVTDTGQLNVSEANCHEQKSFISL